MAERIQIPIPTGELLPADERIRNILNALTDRLNYEASDLHQLTKEYEKGWGHSEETVNKQRNFLQGLDIAWSIAHTEATRRTDSPK
jgi:hypothetical protein